MGKKIYKIKKRLTTPVLLKGNQSASQCLTKKNKNTDGEPKLNIKVLNTLSRAKVEYLKSQNLYTYLSRTG